MAADDNVNYELVARWYAIQFRESVTLDEAREIITNPPDDETAQWIESALGMARNGELDDLADDNYFNYYYGEESGGGEGAAATTGGGTTGGTAGGTTEGTGPGGSVDTSQKPEPVAPTADFSDVLSQSGVVAALAAKGWTPEMVEQLGAAIDAAGWNFQGGDFVTALLSRSGANVQDALVASLANELWQRLGEPDQETWEPNWNDLAKLLPSSVVSSVNTTTGGTTTGGTTTGGSTSGGTTTGTSETTTTSASDQAYIDYLNALAGTWEQEHALAVEELAEKKRQFDEQLAWEREQMEAIGIPELEIQQRLQTLKEEEFAWEMEQAKANLGLQWVTQAAEYAASNPFQLSDFLRGASSQEGVPEFIQALAENVGVSGFGATGEASEEAIRLGDVAGWLSGDTTTEPAEGQPEESTDGERVYTLPTGEGGGSAEERVAETSPGSITTNVVSDDGTTSNAEVTAQSTTGDTSGMSSYSDVLGYDTEAILKAIEAIYTQGAGALAPGTLEKMTEQERALLGQGIEYSYGDDAYPAFLEVYKRTRPQQTASKGGSLAYA